MTNSLALLHPALRNTVFFTWQTRFSIFNILSCTGTYMVHGLRFHKKYGRRDKALRDTLAAGCSIIRGDSFSGS